MNFRDFTRCALIAIAFALPLSLSAEAQESYPEHRVQFRNGSGGLGSVTYASYRGHRPLRADLYFPAEHAERPDWPLVVFIHGGAWRSGTPRGDGPESRWPDLLATLAGWGFVVAAVEYRLYREGQFPAAAVDIQNAIAYLRSQALEYRIDPERVATWGASAGGQLAALMGAACGARTLILDGPDSNAVMQCVAAAVSWYGVHDFRSVRTPAGETGPRFYLGCAPSGCLEAHLAKASPAYYLDEHDAPMLLIHGLEDTLVDVAQTTTFNSAAAVAGVDSQQLLIEGVGHGFVSTSPERTDAAYVQSLQATCRFLWRQLNEPLAAGRKSIDICKTVVQNWD